MRNYHNLLVIAGTLLASACVSMPTVSSPLDAFTPSKVNPNQLVYKEPGVDLAKYHAVMLEPLLFAKREANGEMVFLSAGAKNDINSYYQQQLRRELAKYGVTVSDKAGAGIATLQAAVTGLDLQRPDKKVRDLMPTKLAIDLTKKIVGKESYLLNVSSMTQLVDSQSEKLLVRAMNMRKDKDKVPKDHELTLVDVQALIDDWCQVTAKQLSAHLTLKPR